VTLYTNATYYGETAGYRGKRAFFNIGPVVFELIELVDGKTIHDAFLKEKGEGLHHIGFEVSNLRESIKDAEKLGLTVTQSFIREDDSGFAYLDTDKVGGIVFELIHRAKKKG
jgi:methylmalonyl-CoA/ethylmalonyl-CoA epimerase